MEEDLEKDSGVTCWKVISPYRSDTGGSFVLPSSTALFLWRSCEGKDAKVMSFPSLWTISPKGAKELRPSVEPSKLVAILVDRERGSEACLTWSPTSVVGAIMVWNPVGGCEGKKVLSATGKGNVCSAPWNGTDSGEVNSRGRYSDLISGTVSVLMTGGKSSACDIGGGARGSDGGLSGAGNVAEDG